MCHFKAVNETDIQVVRVFVDESRENVLGYRIGPPPAEDAVVAPYESISALDDRDRATYLRVHVFPSQAHAKVFAEGLVIGGVEEPDIWCGPVKHGYAVLIEGDQALDPGEPEVAVIDYRDDLSRRYGLDGTKHYVVHIWGDVLPHVSGPFQTEEGRDKEALAIRAEEGEEGGIFKATVSPDGQLEMEIYSGYFFEPEHATSALAEAK